eukprot:TRINITY_DN34600_c0_g1_i1.p1 TRINITY_DN34600_c0_g1~~TRINITY_DN34600_c0_g1_i1.p1  ORF type:complete len:328 (+),score=80.01 TRINITY_DN34600_c0_g1_i1:78-1061(+)
MRRALVLGAAAASAVAASTAWCSWTAEGGRRAPAAPRAPLAAAVVMCREGPLQLAAAAADSWCRSPLLRCAFALAGEEQRAEAARRLAPHPAYLVPPARELWPPQQLARCRRKVPSEYRSPHRAATLPHQHRYLRALAVARDELLTDGVEWLLVADDDTLVIPANLRGAVAGLPPGAVWAGDMDRKGYIVCGGGGSLLSREGLTRMLPPGGPLGTAGDRFATACMQWEWMLAELAGPAGVRRVLRGCGCAGGPLHPLPCAVPAGDVYFTQNLPGLAAVQPRGARWPLAGAHNLSALRRGRARELARRLLDAFGGEGPALLGAGDLED